MNVGNLTSRATVSCSRSLPVIPLYCKTAQPPHIIPWSVNWVTRKYRIFYRCPRQSGSHRMTCRRGFPMRQNWSTWERINGTPY